MVNYDTEVVAKRIKECRLSRGLSQEELANLLGKSRTNIVNYEAGRTTLPGSVIVDLANIFRVSTDYLLGLSNDPIITANSLQIKKLHRFMNKADEAKRDRAMQILQLSFMEDFDDEDEDEDL
ncbi:helix-turn-helix transcriptional regulator [Lysinibacillus mangiferihumi]|uniref:Helix-turn-helix transcriptional regulator n=1 Tax=Lysinibacillus mangiferihumi TaxID=1130819 RepID=A0A4U2XYT7_9BACI|nr:helix-turn-helix transcriptional regulator [Lysinibacillus mangiferihumi]TKI53126.1 helix-turn-helix transcriptional regulator [Lysinibacillus mangiferihumi]